MGRRQLSGIVIVLRDRYSVLKYLVPFLSQASVHRAELLLDPLYALLLFSGLDTQSHFSARLVCIGQSCCWTTHSLRFVACWIKTCQVNAGRYSATFPLSLVIV